jgi:hypothetical protein
MQARLAPGSRAAKHESFLRYRGFRWLIIAVLLSIAAYLTFRFNSGAPDFGLQHSGGTLSGYTLGTIGAALILWLTMLGIRKRAIPEGNWLLKGWVSAHVYLGLSLIVIVSLHTGFQFGWNVHTLAYGLMLIVIVSGIAGVVAYSTVPRRLSENRAEMTQKQMLENIRSLDNRLFQAAQPLGRNYAAIVNASIEKPRIAGNFWQRLMGMHRNCPTRRARRRLLKLRGHTKDAAQAATLEQVLGFLKQKNAVLARIRRHIRLRAALEVWLYVHVPMTFALLAALTAHIVSVFFYW